MKRTVSIPVDLPSERFLPLMAQCAEIFNAHVDWVLVNGTYNKNKARFVMRLKMPVENSLQFFEKMAANQ